MNKLAALYGRYVSLVSSLRDLPLLFFRLTLAYGFFEPAMNKVRNFDGIVSWFRSSLQLPFPELNAYLATATEASGVVLLFLGLGTRIIALPMMVVMIVAITTVHIGNGFACGDNGFEVPFYYLLMLFCLVVYGAGRVSVDHLLARRSL